MAAEHYEAEIARLEKQVQDLKIQLGQEKRTREKDLISFEAREAARAEGVQEIAIPDVVTRAINSGLFKVDSRDRLVRFENGGPVTKEDGNPGTVRDWVKDLRPTAPHWWGHAAPTEGSGKDGPNPWLKASWNLTEQGRLVTENPALASKLADEAGVTLPPPVKKWPW